MTDLRSSVSDDSTRTSSVLLSALPLSPARSSPLLELPSVAMRDEEHRRVRRIRSGGGAEVAVSALSLEGDQWDCFRGHLDPGWSVVGGPLSVVRFRGDQAAAPPP